MTASYDVNNHQGGEDANGNPGYIPAPAFGTSVQAIYDVENRLVAANMNYSYDPANHRAWRGTVSGGTTDEITFWSVSGRKLGAYEITFTQGTEQRDGDYYAPYQWYFTQTGTNYYFGSMLIKDNNGWVYPDRLGSISNFYPYGIERPSATTNGTEKFTGYFRDSETGNDYAVNRYESPGTGRFVTPDPLPSSANASDPGSWNRYAYVGGDPANRTDPTGLCDPFDPTCFFGTPGGSPGQPVYVGNDTCQNLMNAAAVGDPVAISLLGVYCGSGYPGGTESCSANYASEFSPSGGPAEQTDCGPGTPVAIEPDCTLQLFRRPAKFKGNLGQHTYLELCEGAACEIVEGGRDNKKASSTNGDLIGFINPPGGNVLGAGTSHASRPGSDTQIGSTESIPCSDIDIINSIVGAYNSGSPVPYTLIPLSESSYNSNSFTFTLLGDFGLQGDFSLPAYNSAGFGLWYPGWGNVVPGLNNAPL